MILIVEDSKVINSALSKELSKKGYAVDKAFTYSQAEKYLKQKDYELIILDLHLPDGEGMELIAAIKSLTTTKVVVLTSSTDEELREELFEFGIIDYIVKDKNIYYSIAEVLKVIETINKKIKHNILVVDDSKFITRQIKRILEPRNYNVSLAYKGLEALIELKKEKYDLIILDMELPDMHGVEVLNKIRGLKDYLQTPVIVLSGTTTPEIVRTILKEGANDFLKKPFVTEEFVLKVDLWIDYLDKRLELEKKNKELNYLNSNLNLLIQKEIEKNKEQEKMMLLKSRQAQMGEILAMIAHQWKQPLNVISLAINMIKLEMEEDERFSNLIEKVQEQVRYLSNTIDEFRNFFKPQKEKVFTTLEDVVNKALSLISDSLQSKNIKVEIKRLSVEKVLVYENELIQVVMNILKNAEDVLIEREIKNPNILIEVEKKRITIEDNAGGIPEDTIDKIFEPYFSTKGKNGTGLGLYMSKIIIEEHMDGKIRIENSENGAKFIIEL